MSTSAARRPAGVGLLHTGTAARRFANYELRRSPKLVEDALLQRKLHDAQGRHRGDLVGEGMSVGSLSAPGWSSFGRDKHILLDAYRPERLPTSGDWLLVLENK